MKQTGVTRKIDELGRIVIPKEIRKNLGIRDGDTIEIYTDQDSLVLKKYFEVRRYEDICNKVCELIKNIYNIDLVITDRDKVISSSNKSISNNSKLSKELVELIDERKMLISNELLTIKFNEDIKGYFTVVPIVVSSDSLGLIVLISECLGDYECLAKFIAKILVDKIDVF